MTTRRHVIIEGCDGSGKDTLIESLVPLFPGHVLHKRASTSLGGPVPDLAAWASHDVRTMPVQPPSLYNRHPMVSENIYAKHRRTGRVQEPEWRSLTWLNALRQSASQHAVLVICDPGFQRVRRTVEAQGRGAHMPGVFDNLESIYLSYAFFNWPGKVFRYNYMNTTPDALANNLRIAMGTS